MPGSAFDITKPADTDLVRNAPTLFRQDKSTLKLQMEVEHYVLPAALGVPGDTGRHRFPSGLTAGRPSNSPAVPSSIYVNGETGVIEMQDGVGVWFDIASIVPVGAIILWTLNAIPAHYLECNGQAVSRTTYARLFATIATVYGVGDGSTTFNLPNLSGRVPVGVLPADPDFGFMPLTGGAKTHTPSQSARFPPTVTGSPIRLTLTGSPIPVMATRFRSRRISRERRWSMLRRE